MLGLPEGEEVESRVGCSVGFALGNIVGFAEG